MSWTHVYPINDTFDHNLEGHECDCNPFIDFKNDLVIHSAFDGRDLIEELGDEIVDLPNGGQIKINHDEYKVRKPE